MEEAQAAMANAMESAVCREYFDLMELSAEAAGDGVLHFHCLRRY